MCFSVVVFHLCPYWRSSLIFHVFGGVTALAETARLLALPIGVQVFVA